MIQRACFHARRLLGSAGLAALAALAPAGCGSDSLATVAASPPDAATTQPPELADAQPAPTLSAVCSDGQILAILAAEFTARVEIAGAVRALLGSPSALDLAEKIFTDDSVARVQVQGEMRETGIAFVPGGVAHAIAAEALGTIQALAAQSAPAVDESYVDREVLAHVRALALIDSALVPNVHDARVRDLLARVRDLVVQHAEAASQAESALEGRCRPSSN